MNEQIIPLGKAKQIAKGGRQYPATRRGPNPKPPLNQQVRSLLKVNKGKLVSEQHILSLIDTTPLSLSSMSSYYTCVGSLESKAGIILRVNLDEKIYFYFQTLQEALKYENLSRKWVFENLSNKEGKLIEKKHNFDTFSRFHIRPRYKKRLQDWAILFDNIKVNK